MSGDLSLVLYRTQEHSEKITRFIRVGEQVELFEQAGAGQAVAEIAQRREILDRETDRVEQRDLACIAPALGLARNHLPEFVDPMGTIQLLDGIAGDDETGRDVRETARKVSAALVRKSRSK